MASTPDISKEEWEEELFILFALNTELVALKASSVKTTVFCQKNRY